MARASASTTAWAELRADVDLTKVKLTALRTQSQRIVEDVDAILNSPPFIGVPHTWDRSEVLVEVERRRLKERPSE